MFVILFGLSMDYHVFILSRIREAHDRGLTTEDAVAHGIKTTAGVVTSAALVMVGVFSIFAGLPLLEMKEAGFGSPQPSSSTPPSSAPSSSPRP